MNTTTSPPAANTATVTSPPAIRQKLTKKQKKALAFRDNTTKTKYKTKHKKDDLTGMADPDGSLVEKSNLTRRKSNQMEVGGMEGKGGESSEGRSKKTSESKEGTRNDRVGEGKREREREREKQKQVTEDVDGKGQKRGEKRKRGQLDDGVVQAGRSGVAEKNKKRKREKVELGVDKDEEGESKGEGEEVSGEEDKGKKVNEKEKQRLILFIGNLKYTTTIDAIKAHFSACDPLPEVRLLTPKATSTSKTTAKSKGCAFLEFQMRPALQQALKLHHSVLEGRMINVELTAGGGGKSEKRMEKVRERNKELLGQRKKKAEKQESKDGSLPSRPDKPQRYSATSGIEQSSSSSNKRTWSVGDVADDEVHRGGKKFQKAERSRKLRVKDWGTGVNAIPVG